jgi:hypothetical protein
LSAHFRLSVHKSQTLAKRTELSGWGARLLSKNSMRKNGVDSRDLIDAMSFAILEDCHCVP